MTPYPSSLPLGCVTTLVNGFKNGTLMEDKVETAHCAWNVQGYLMGQLLGNPTPSTIFGGNQGDSKVAAALGDLKVCISDWEDLPEKFGTEFGAVDSENQSFIDFLEKVLPMILALLKMLDKDQ